MHLLDADSCDFVEVFFPPVGGKQFEIDPLVVIFGAEDLDFASEVDLAFAEHDAVGTPLESVNSKPSLPGGSKSQPKARFPIALLRIITGASEACPI